MSENIATGVRKNVAERQLIMERVFAAPRELVFKAFSDPAALAHWWGPTGWTLPVCQLDFRPGGIWHYCMRSSEGQDAWGKAVYREIVAPERIVYVDSFSDAEGNIASDMAEMLITLTFEEQAGKTKLTSYTQFASVADLEAVLAMGAVEGMGQTWDRLEQYLAG